MQKNHAKIKVMLFSDSFDIGGTELYFLNLANKLDKQKFDVKLGCFLRKGLLLKKIEQAFDLYNFPINNAYISPNGFYQIYKLAKTLRKESFDLLYTSHYYTNVIAGIAAKLAGIKHIAGLHGEICPKRRRDYFASNFASINADAIISNSKFLFQQTLSREKLVSKEKMYLVKNGIEQIKTYSPKEIEVAKKDIGIMPDQKVLISVARHEKIKGHKYLLDAFAELINRGYKLKLLLVGDGAERAELLKQAKRLAISGQVIFLGFRSDVDLWLLVSDIFVLPSLSESVPYAVLEAMSTELPVIASDVGGLREIITNNKTGILVESKNSAELSAQIKKLLDNENFASKLALMGKLSVNKDYSLDKMVSQISEIFCEVVGAKA